MAADTVAKLILAEPAIESDTALETHQAPVVWVAVVGLVYVVFSVE